MEPWLMPYQRDPPWVIHFLWETPFAWTWSWRAETLTCSPWKILGPQQALSTVVCAVYLSAQENLFWWSQTKRCMLGFLCWWICAFICSFGNCSAVAAAACSKMKGLWLREVVGRKFSWSQDSCIQGLVYAGWLWLNHRHVGSPSESKNPSHLWILIGFPRGFCMQQYFSISFPFLG